MTLHEDAVAASVRVTRPLEAREIPYAIGGAVAYGFWGVPRATVHVDLSLFVDPPDLPGAIAALVEGGAQLDEAAAIASRHAPRRLHA